MAFGAHSPEVFFDESEFHFFREFAATVSMSIHNARVVQRLRQANFELQDSQAEWFQKTRMSAIEKLAAGIAHEVHNPLAIISGKAQVLLMQKGRAPLEPHIEEALNAIVKQTRRAADITRKLLMYAQDSQSSEEWVSLEKVVDDTIALVGYQVSLGKIEITKSVGPDLPQFLSNLQEIREIFLNLFLNAVEAIGSEGRIHIELKHQKEDGILEIQFSDSGRGISPENIDKIFNPFFTTRHEAVGLGLFVTRQIVNRRGGAIRLKAGPEKAAFLLFSCHAKKIKILIKPNRPEKSTRCR